MPSSTTSRPRPERNKHDGCDGSHLQEHVPATVYVNARGLHAADFLAPLPTLAEPPFGCLEACPSHSPAAAGDRSGNLLPTAPCDGGARSRTCGAPGICSQSAHSRTEQVSAVTLPAAEQSCFFFFSKQTLASGESFDCDKRAALVLTRPAPTEPSANDPDCMITYIRHKTRPIHDHWALCLASAFPNG
jgi:hypothetical protein